MNGPRRIGILGGMGPQATVLLMQRLIDAVPAKDDSDHIPLVVDNNTQVPSRIRALIEGGAEDPGPVLAAMARRLENAGVEALAMPCNTAHYYAPEIERATALPFLNMVQLSARAARDAAGEGGKVGILASPAIRTVGIFDRVLASWGLNAVYPEDQDSLLGAIRAIKKSGDTPAARSALASGSSWLLEKRATIQLVACSEFSIVADAAADGATVIDTLDVLVAEIVRFSRGQERGRVDERLTG